MTLVAFNIENPESVAHELEEANRRLAREREVPESVLDLLSAFAAQVGETETRAVAEQLDPLIWIDLQQAAIRALTARDEGDPREQRRKVRVALEALRFLLARLAEAQPAGEQQPIEDVIRWFDQAVHVRQGRKAELMGVSERTYQRWISEDTGHPSADDEWRIRVVARIVIQLRHALTGPGVVEWFARPRDDLDGQRPVDLLRDPEATSRLIALATAVRAGGAA
jgi:uncharacterized protein (DUF2384 family)